MSRNNLWQVCHSSRSGNNHLTKALVVIIRKRGMTSKQIAKDILISTERVRNWYYKGTGMTAFDLLLLMCEYDFIRIYVNETINEYSKHENNV
jgi:hypothetical protein